MNNFTFLGVPTAAGTHGPGQEMTPAALRNRSILSRLQEFGVTVQDAGDLILRPYSPDALNPTKQNLNEILDLTREVDEAVTKILSTGSVPIVVGGDCTVSLGVLSALVRRWPTEAGLIYVDGDLDLAVPEDTLSGIMDTMVLSHIMGFGNEQLLKTLSRYPLLEESNIFAYGFDPGDLSDKERSFLSSSLIGHMSSKEITSKGLPIAATKAWEAVSKTANRIMLHFDIDVIDSTEFPLANYPHYNEGLPYETAMESISLLFRNEHVSALVLTEVNPLKDQNLGLLDKLTDRLVEIVNERHMTGRILA